MVGADIQDRGKTKPQRFGALQLKTRKFQDVEICFVWQEIKRGSAEVAAHCHFDAAGFNHVTQE